MVLHTCIVYIYIYLYILFYVHCDVYVYIFIYIPIYNTSMQTMLLGAVWKRAKADILRNKQVDM